MEGDKNYSKVGQECERDKEPAIAPRLVGGGTLSNGTRHHSVTYFHRYTSLR